MTERTEGDYGDHHLQVFTSICLLLAIRFVMCQGERIDKTRGMTQKSYKTLIAFLVEITTVSVAVTASRRTVGSSACSLTTLLYFALAVVTFT